MKKKGISLIVLIITIVVVIILASAIILELNDEDNIMDNADELLFKENISNYKEELEDYISNIEFESNGRFDRRTVNGIGDELKSMIPIIIEEDIAKFEVKNGKLKYIDLSSPEQSKWASEVLD